MKSPEQSLARHQGEPPKGAEQAQTPDQIQRQRQFPVQPPQTSQQIIAEAQSGAHQNSQKKLPGLYPNRQFHQPKSRVQNPPLLCIVSS